MVDQQKSAKGDLGKGGVVESREIELETDPKRKNTRDQTNVGGRQVAVENNFVCIYVHAEVL